MPKLRVLVVEDSPTVMHRLCEVLTADPGIEVVGVAEEGGLAIERCLALRPDVVTLDMSLPVLSGVAVTEHIMAHFPTPILIVSASTNRGDLFNTYDALTAGAVDVLEKPRGDEAEGAWERTFVSAVKLVSRIRVITHLRARLGPLGRAPTAPPPAPPAPLPSAQRPRAFALGASTGGPAALLEVLRAIPTGLPVTGFVVLHIGAAFGVALIDWLGEQTAHAVVAARDGEPVSALRGSVVVAPPEAHLRVRGGRLRLTRDEPRNWCRPSVDVLFESLAAEYGPAVIAGLLTGMGRDGAAGLLAIQRAGGVTVAQDEATSVVYGMPREAALLGAAGRVLPLGEIGPMIARRASGLRGG